MLHCEFKDYRETSVDLDKAVHYELPYLGGDSNEYTQHTIFSIKKENPPKLSQICSYGIFTNSRTSSKQPW